MPKPPYYSCDSHVVEPPEVFAGLAERFGERAPRVVHGIGKGEAVIGSYTEGVFLQWPKLKQAFLVGRFGCASHDINSPATEELIKRGWEGMNPGVYDPAAHLREQEQDGIVGEVMYPSMNMFAFSVPDRDVVQALFQRHNDWIADYCSHAPV